MLRAENRKLRDSVVLAADPAFRLPDEADWLAMVARIFHHHGAIEDVFEKFAHELRSMMRVEEAVVYLYDRDISRLHGTLSRANGDEVPIQLRLGQGIAGWVAEQGRPANIKDATSDKRHFAPLTRHIDVDVKATLCVPVFDRAGKVSAVIQLWNPVAREYFAIREEELLKAMAAVLGILVEGSRLFMSELQRNAELIDTRGKLEARVGELDRLYEFSRRLAVANRMEQELELAAEAALTMVPSEICLVSMIDDGEPTSWICGPDPKMPLRLWKETRQATYASVVSGCAAKRLRGDKIDELDLFESLGIERRSHVIVPLHVEDRCIGAIELLNRNRDAADGGYGGYRNADIRLLTVLAGQTSSIIANNIARRDQERHDRISAIGSMVSGIFHDLKTPLTIASGYVQLMERSDDEVMRRRFGDAVQKQFDHIQQMIHEVIAYARGELEVFERNVHMSLFARELSEWLTHEFQDYGISVKVLSDFTGDARFDEGKLKRVLFNLSRNAREAMKVDGGSYTVRISKTEDNRLEFCCKDTGPGIPDHVQARLFEAFVSTGKATRSGLGLAIVKRLTSEMDGFVTFESELGVGTEFTVSLPYHELVDDSDTSAAAE